METCCRLLVTFFFTTLLFQSIHIFAGEISPGQRAPEFNLRNIKGDLIRPFEDKKPIIVSFFFTECSTCRNEIKALSEMSQRYSGITSVYLVGTSFKRDVDITEDIELYMHSTNSHLIPLVDKYKDVIRKYGITRYPAIFLIGRNRKIFYSCSAYSDTTIRELEQKLKKMK